MRRTFIFRSNYYLGLMRLEPDKRLEAYDAIMRYAFEGEQADVSQACAPMLAVIFDCIDTDFRKHEQRNGDGEK